MGQLLFVLSFHQTPFAFDAVLQTLAEQLLGARPSASFWGEDELGTVLDHTEFTIWHLLQTSGGSTPCVPLVYLCF